MAKKKISIVLKSLYIAKAMICKANEKNFEKPQKEIRKIKTNLLKEQIGGREILPSRSEAKAFIHCESNGLQSKRKNFEKPKIFSINALTKTNK